MVDVKGLRNLPFEVVQEQSMRATGYDGLLFVSVNGQPIGDQEIWNAISLNLNLDSTLASQVSVVPLPTVPAGRIVHAATGNLDADYDDVRSLRESALNGTQRALRVGIRRLLVVVQEAPEFANSQLVILLGVLQALYVPIQVRELTPGRLPMVERLGIYAPNNISSILQNALILDSGLRVTKDIVDADPERMTPPKVQEYVEDIFANSSVRVDVVDDDEVFAREYPLFEAVNRATKFTERHHGRIIYLEYNPPDPSRVTETLIFVAKGVTVDIGGVDVKINGNLVGMSRDKGAAAAVAGLLHVVNLLQPPNIRVIGGLAMVRNSIGSNAYVPDEIIKARSGAMVRVINTDAEGRFAMADVLCRLKDVALTAVNPKLFVLGTLTGHAMNSAGIGYCITLDNGPARREGVSYRIQKGGQGIADPFEVSVIRREDFSNYRGRAVGDDVTQIGAHNRRGHQGVAAFMLLASGLDRHGSGSDTPLKYTHLDIAGSINFPEPALGQPLLALANTFFLNP